MTPFKYGLAMNEGRDSEGGLYQLTHELRLINQFLGNLYKPRILLETCCGSGSVSSLIHLSGLQVIGLDTSRMALNRFHEQSSDVSLTQGDAICMPFADDSIDCIIAIHCFDHLNRVRFLEECNRVLSGSSYLIFESLNRNSYKWVLKKLLTIFRKRSFNHSGEKWINIYSCREVLNIVNDCGFYVQAVDGYNWIPFTQISNSKLIKLFAYLEEALHLNRFYMISPRFLVIAKKREISNDED